MHIIAQSRAQRRTREALPWADRSSDRYPLFRRNVLRRGETGTIWRTEKKRLPEQIFNGPGVSPGYGGDGLRPNVR